MPLLLPELHPCAEPGAPRAGALRIGILNLMPRLEAYEPSLLGPLARSGHVVEPVFVRLESHGYGSSDHAHLARFYRPFADAGELDGLILTGAPVEELAFDAVRYWAELEAILRSTRAPVLGLCWGGMALAGMLGIPKVVFPKKLFGVYENAALEPGHPLVPGRFVCAQSRHSGIVDAELERAQADGRVRLLGHAPETGYTVFETVDERWLMHLGHPEYEGERLAFEWERDRGLGRKDVDPPHDFDVSAPVTRWREHRETLFARWLLRARAAS